MTHINPSSAAAGRTTATAAHLAATIAPDEARPQFELEVELALRHTLLGGDADLPSEQWRPVIVEHDGQAIRTRYEVSNMGRVRSSHVRKFRDSEGRTVSRRVRYLIKPRKSGIGYLTVTICYGTGSGKTHQSDAYVHSLVASAFLGPRPQRYVTDHINRDRHDNRADNLRYVSRRDNLLNTGKPLRGSARLQIGRNYAVCFERADMPGHTFAVTQWRVLKKVTGLNPMSVKGRFRVTAFGTRLRFRNPCHDVFVMWQRHISEARPVTTLRGVHVISDTACD